MNRQWNRKFRNIILIGMPAAGKSTLGKILACHTRRNFLDVDSLIEKSLRKSVAEIFAEEGEEAFRAAELRCLKKLQRAQSSVIAMGGGTLCRPENFALARQMGVIIMLDAPFEVLAKRIFPRKEHRPMFADCQSVEEVQEKLKALWEARREYYEEAEFRLFSEFSSIDNLVLQITSFERKFFNRDHQNDMGLIRASDRSQRNIARPVEQDVGMSDEPSEEIAVEVVEPAVVELPKERVLALAVGAPLASEGISRIEPARRPRFDEREGVPIPRGAFPLQKERTGADRPEKRQSENQPRRFQGNARSRFVRGGRPEGREAGPHQPVRGEPREKDRDENALRPAPDAPGRRRPQQPQRQQGFDARRPPRPGFDPRNRAPRGPRGARGEPRPTGSPHPEKKRFPTESEG